MPRPGLHLVAFLLGRASRASPSFHHSSVSKRSPAGTPCEAVATRACRQRKSRCVSASTSRPAAMFRARRRFDELWRLSVSDRCTCAPIAFYPAPDNHLASSADASKKNSATPGTSCRDVRVFRRLWDVLEEACRSARRPLRRICHGPPNRGRCEVWRPTPTRPTSSCPLPPRRSAGDLSQAPATCSERASRAWRAVRISSSPSGEDERQKHESRGHAPEEHPHVHLPAVALPGLDLVEFGFM